MARRRKTRTVAELLGVSQAFVYELKNFQEAALFYIEQRPFGQNPKDHRFLNNWRVEAFAIHTRNIVGFLYAPDGWYTDDEGRYAANYVIADDFFEDPHYWRDKRLPQTDLLKDAFELASKTIAHFNYGRQGPSTPGPEWDVEGILQSVTLAMEDFLSRAPNDRIHADLRNFRFELDAMPPIREENTHDPPTHHRPGHHRLSQEPVRRA